MFSLKKASKLFCSIVIILLVFEFFFYYTSKHQFDSFLKTNFLKGLNESRQKTVLKINKDFYSISKNELKDQSITNSKISWENVTQIKMDAKRVGPGEQGLPYTLTDPEDIKENEKLFKVEGFYVVASNRISVERALPDKRPEA